MDIYVFLATHSFWHYLQARLALRQDSQVEKHSIMVMEMGLYQLHVRFRYRGRKFVARSENNYHQE